MVSDHVLRRLGRAREHVVSTLEGALTVEALAETAGMSPFHFLRVFKAAYGVTPGRFVSDTRIAHARELLARGEAVTAVCQRVGFESLGSFSTAFRRRYGQSPRDLQRSVRRVGQVPARIIAVRAPFCFIEQFAPSVAARLVD